MLAIFWIGAYYLLRVVSWNISGTETYAFDEQFLTYTAKSKRLKIRFEQFPLNELEFETEILEQIKSDNLEEDYVARLILLAKEKKLITAFKLSKRELEHIVEQLREKQRQALATP